MPTGGVSGTMLNGIMPDYESRVSEVADKMKSGKLSDLVAGQYGIVLGAELANYLGVMMAIKLPSSVRKLIPRQRVLCPECGDLPWWVFFR